MDLSARLAQAPLILDGAMGTALFAAGLTRGAPPERWNLDHPVRVQQVHEGYLAAGSQVVQSNSFGGNPMVLAQHGLDGQVEAINRAAVQIARRAVDRAGGGLVAGNVGPSGQLLPPVGNADPGALTDAFARQAAALAHAGADFIAIETMTDLRESLCALEGTRRACALPVTVCLTFDKKKRGFFTLMGDRPGDVVRRLSEAGATAVGANCSVGSAALLELAPELLAVSSVPVFLKPNAGLPEVTAAGLVYHQRPEDFARDLAAAVAKGVSAVGGCCGTDPRFIRALVAQL